MNKKGIELGLAFTLCLSFFVSPVVAYSTESDVYSDERALSSLYMNCSSPLYTSIDSVSLDSLLTLQSSFNEITGWDEHEFFFFRLKMPDRVNGWRDSYYSVNDSISFYLIHSVDNANPAREYFTIVNADDIGYVRQFGGVGSFSETKWGEINGSNIYFQNSPFFGMTDFSIPRYSFVSSSYSQDIVLINSTSSKYGFIQIAVNGLQLPLLSSNAAIPGQQGIKAYFLGFSSVTNQKYCSNKSPNGNLDNTIGEYDKIESEQVDNMVENLGKVDTSNPVLSNNGFVNSSKFLATQLTNIYNIEPFKMMSTYSLVIGLALIIVGIGVRKR